MTPAAGASLLASDFSFGGLDLRVHLVWAIPLLVLLAVYAARRRRRALAVFAPAAAGGPYQQSVARRRCVRLALLSAGLLLLIFAALQPRSNPVKVKGKAEMRDLVVLLDVSKSMLAEDRKPNRLESVKLELSRLADHLSGTRVGLIAFAGDAVVVCPLTPNYSYFKRALQNVSVRTAGQGGTRIGDAIRKAVGDLLGLAPVAKKGEKPKAGQTVMDEAQAKKEGRYADLLLVTDGEDHDSFPEYAAKQLRALGVGLYIVGVGSPNGDTIPTASGPLEYKGKVVKTALMDKTLRELVVDAARGRYLPASVHHFDLVDFYEKAIRKDGGRESSVTRVEWQEVYQPFLLAGLLAVLLSFLVPLRPPSGNGREEEA